ncbi:DMT family transporter [Candidatus Bathyarchaeota archaeon]|jgi:drug/metabolite transporter (DMT)-like permease|nr:DMT family transporter [Candidatus Bathyarchaeota archaeon]
MSHHWGYISAIASAVLFGISSTLNKITLQNVNPTVVAGIIYFVGGLLLFGIHLTPLCKRILSSFETPEAEAKISRKDLKILAFVILCGSITAPLLLLNGLSQTTAINTSLLLNAESLFTALMAFIFLRERGTRGEYLGVLLLLVGVVFVTTNGAFQQLTLTENITGSLLIMGACLFWGIDNNLSRFLSKKRDIILITGLKCFIGGLALLIISYLLGIDFSTPIISIPYLLSVGALSIAFSILLFLLALRKIGAMRTGVVFSTSSLFGAVLAFAALRESFTPIQLIAGLVMLLGVYVLYRYPK